MTTSIEMPSEYPNLPLLNLSESPANPRRTFDETALNELAESIHHPARYQFAVENRVWRHALLQFLGDIQELRR
jgi:hypothetical protein